MLRPFTSETLLTPQVPGWEDQLGFDYCEVDAMWLSRWTAEVGWQEGRLFEHQGARLELSPGAHVLQYGQGIVEGLKAHRAGDGTAVLFRATAHARRLRQSAAFLAMEAPPVASCLEAIAQVFRANLRWLPPYGKGNLYIRPMIIGSGPVLAVHPSKEYAF